MLFDLDYANNTISLCFFFFFLVTDLYFLIPVVVAQIFNPIAELVIPIGIPIKEEKAENEIDPVIVETKIKKCSINFTHSQTFLRFLLINLFHSSRR